MKKVKQIQFNKSRVNHLQGLDEGPRCGVRSPLYCSAKSAPFSSSEISLSSLNFSLVCECGRSSSRQYQAVKFPPGKGAPPAQCKLTLLLSERWETENRLQFEDHRCALFSRINILECHSGKHFQIFCVQRFLSFRALLDSFSLRGISCPASAQCADFRHPACTAELASAMFI